MQSVKAMLLTYLGSARFWVENRSLPAAEIAKECGCGVQERSVLLLISLALVQH